MGARGGYSDLQALETRWSFRGSGDIHSSVLIPRGEAFSLGRVNCLFCRSDPVHLPGLGFVFDAGRVYRGVNFEG